MWYIAWTSWLTGCEGRTLARYTTRAEAEADCAEMNAIYPGTLHWAVPQRGAYA